MIQQTLSRLLTEAAAAAASDLGLDRVAVAVDQFLLAALAAEDMRGAHHE